MKDNFPDQDKTLETMIDCSKKGDIKTIKEIIKYGNLFPEDFDVSLYEAARHGHLNIVKLLLKYNKSNNPVALEYAATNNQLEVVKYLLKNRFYTQNYFAIFHKIQNPDIFTLILKQYIERFPNDLETLNRWAKDNKMDLVLEMLRNKVRIEKLSKII